MYLGIDIGGTKTLIAVLDQHGVIQEQLKFPTPRTYKQFITELTDNVANLSTKKFTAACVAAPGKIDRESGVALDFGNLPWHDVPLQADVAKIADCPTVVENDANLAGLSEAMLVKEYDRVLYITISTGIGTGIISHQEIDPDFADSEGGRMPLEHHGKIQMWESFASGRAIVARFGKRAEDIHDVRTW
ncbi:MAG TPA: ROK family protein, partial [Ktedonobacteraceae bacterium]|nr:ROK family protein [Ktedonobacteraceae bacterium]